MEKFENFCLNWLSIPILLCGFYLMCTNFNVPSIMIFILGAFMTITNKLDYGNKQRYIGMMIERLMNEYHKEMYNHAINNEDTFTISLPLEYDIILQTIICTKFVYNKITYSVININKTNENIQLIFTKEEKEN